VFIPDQTIQSEMAYVVQKPLKTYNRAHIKEEKHGGSN